VCYNQSVPATRYNVPAGETRVEQVIDRSRFITTLALTSTPEAAREFIARVAAQFADATHNCWAFNAGAPGDTAQVGMSDDGEPHGTAGRPMLAALLHSGVGEVAAVVTRYFGGVKLGKGGLVRAYTGGVQQALAEAVLVPRIDWRGCVVALEYPLLEQARRMLPQFEAELLGEDFAADVRLKLRLPAEQAVGFTAAVVELSAGRAQVAWE
jgi:uncharacterized YigZ family protein